MVAVEAAGRQIPIAFLERVNEDFLKRYGGGKAMTATANSLNKEFGYIVSWELLNECPIVSYLTLYIKNECAIT